MSIPSQLANSGFQQMELRRRHRRAGHVSWRVAVTAGRFEAARLSRSPFLLGGLVIAAVLVWWNSRASVPQWWVWDVQLPSTLLALAGPVLVLSHLAAGRVARDGATQLYESYPASATVRTTAHLLALTGPLVAAGALLGAAMAWLFSRGPVGTPAPGVLMQGPLLIALAGAVGVAMASYLPHPAAGVLLVVVLGLIEADLLLPFGGPLQLPGGTAWLFPWAQPTALRWTPGPVPAVPPSAHFPWLLALIVASVIAALGRAVWRPATRRTTGLTALIAAGCLALAGWSGWQQVRPVPGDVQTQLADQIVHPAKAEQCLRQQGIVYCSYRGFSADRARWAVAINGVMDRLPRRPARPLVIRQVVDVNVYAAPLYGGYGPTANSQMAFQASRVGAFITAEGYDARLIPGSDGPPIYTDVSWAAGPAAGGYQLDLAMQAARSVVGLPTTWRRSVTYSCGRECGAQAQIVCMPVGQAREAIALWLAAGATTATRPAFSALLRNGQQATRVGDTWIKTYSGVTGYGYSAALQFTAQAGLLARAMLRLPAGRVAAVLASRWPRWLNPKATDSQLAKALAITLPRVPAVVAGQGQPPDPVCR